MEGGTVNPDSCVRGSCQEINGEILHSHPKIKTLGEERDMCRTDSFKYSNTDENPGRKGYLNKNNSHQITTLIPNAVLEGAKEGANHIKRISSLFTLFLNLFPLTQCFKEEKAGEGECIILSSAGFYRAPSPAQHVRRRVCALDQLQLAKRFGFPHDSCPLIYRFCPGFLIIGPAP